MPTSGPRPLETHPTPGPKQYAGRSPQRPIRIPDDVWYPAVARAKADGRPIGHVVTEMLRNYIADD